MGWWHRGGVNFAFADGHTEYWLWKDARTLLIGYSFFANTPNNPDCIRVKVHSAPGHPSSPWRNLVEP